MKPLIAAFALLVLAAAPATAMHHGKGLAKVGNIKIEQAWARATPGKVPNGAAYLTLSAEGEETDRLIAVASPVAKRVELHTHLMEEGVMKMRRIKAIEVAPGSPSVLKPGGHHVMLMGLQAPLKQGEKFPLTLTFERAGSVEVMVTVEKIGATEPAAHDHSGHGS